MTPKQIALKNVSIFVATAFIIGVALAYVISYVSLATVVTVSMVALFAYFMKVLYDIELSKAEALDKLNGKQNDNTL
jgi:hypothetical protein